MKFPDKGILLDIFKGSLATLALFLACISLPLAGFLPGIFAPFPAIFYGLKNGKTAGTAIVLITTTLLAVIADPVVPLLFMAQCGMISLAFPHFVGRGWRAGRAMLLSIAIASAVILLAAVVFWITQGVDPNQAVQKGISSSIAHSSALYEKSGLKGEELQALQQGVKEAGELLARTYPAMALVSLGIIAGCNLLALKRLAGRFNWLPSVGDFRKYRNPDHLIWLLIAGGFSLLIRNDGISTVALNFLTVVLVLYFLQGLAIVVHFLDQFRVNRVIRVIFYVLLAMQPYLLAAVAVFGIFDLWGNFRTPKKQENL